MAPRWPQKVVIHRSTYHCAPCPLVASPIPASIAEGAEWLASHYARFRAQTALRWAIVPVNIEESIGTIGLILPAPGARTAKLGFVIARAHWNRGFGTSSARLVARYAFATLALAELHAETLRRNHASRRILEKLGFRHLRAIPADPRSPNPEDGHPEAFNLYLLANPTNAA